MGDQAGPLKAFGDEDSPMSVFAVGFFVYRAGGLSRGGRRDGKRAFLNELKET